MVCGLGSTTYDAGAAGDRALNFYLWGAMGGAAMIGLGLALAQPRRRVLVLTGDGEMLMGMGSLATIAAQKPANLAIAVMDNGRFGETGQQHSHTALGTDLAAVAAGCGWAAICTVRDMQAVEALRPRLAPRAAIRGGEDLAVRGAAASAAARRRVAGRAFPSRAGREAGLSVSWPAPCIVPGGFAARI